MQENNENNPSPLRLVQPSAELAIDPMTSWAKQRRAEIETSSENRRAAGNPGLDPNDPRWVLAARAYSHLQGSALTPERRSQVMRTAAQLGVRPFEANMVIAIVQDQARRGRQLGDAEPLLNLIPQHDEGNNAARRTARLRTILQIISIVFLALVLALGLILWTLSG